MGSRVNAPKDFERVGRRGFYRPMAVVTFEQALTLFVNAMKYAREQELADLLVGVTGDFVPPAMVLRLGFLARLFVQPIPRTSSIHARHA